MPAVSRPTVAVIIPAYNGVKRGFLWRAIDSVLAQTRPVDELIVVDDGSQDDTAGVVARRYPAARVLPKANGGVASARTHGLRATRADYVALLDDDDEWLPNKIERQLAYLEGEPGAGMVFSAVQCIDAAGKPLCVWRKGALPTTYPALLIANPVCAPSTVLLRRAVIDAVGDFDPRFRVIDDYDYWIRVAKRFRIGYLDEVLVRYRMHALQESRRLMHMQREALSVVEGHLPAPRDPRSRRVLCWFIYGALLNALVRRHAGDVREWSRRAFFEERLHPLVFLMRVLDSALGRAPGWRSRWRAFEATALGLSRAQTAPSTAATGGT